MELGVFERCVHIKLLADALVEGSVARSPSRGGPAGVEPQHRDVGECRQAPGGLAEHVGIHESAVRGQGMQRDEGRARGDDRGDGQFSHEAQSIARVQFDVFAVARKDCERADRGGAVGVGDAHSPHPTQRAPTSRVSTALMVVPRV